MHSPRAVPCVGHLRRPSIKGRSGVATIRQRYVNLRQDPEASKTRGVFVLKELTEMRKFNNFINKEKEDYNLSQDWDSAV